MSGGQPTHDELKRTSGDAHVTGVHDANDVGAVMDFGMYPGGHVYEPARHEDCVESGKEPSGQELHAEDPAGAYLLDTHATQVDALVAATALLAVPGGHCVQLEEPSDLLYEPAAQEEQLDALDPPMSAFENPRGQK